MRSIDDLKRKQGIALLHHIAKVWVFSGVVLTVLKSYGIQIEILDSATSDSDRKRRLNNVDNDERLKKAKSETVKNM